MAKSMSQTCPAAFSHETDKSDASADMDMALIVEKLKSLPSFLGSQLSEPLKGLRWSKTLSGPRKLVQVGGVPGKTPVQAEITWIGRISQDNFSLFVEGGWREESPFKAYGLQGTKARACIVDPGKEPYSALWKTTIEGARKLMEHTCKGLPGELGKKLLVSKLPDGEECMKVRHTVYEEFRDQQQFERARKKKNQQIGNLTFLSMENWKCKNLDVQKYHDAIVATNKKSTNGTKSYLGHALPVFDTTATPINPSDYHRILPGAIVEINAHLSHHIYGRDISDPPPAPREYKSEHNFYADITYITVLENAPPDPVSEATQRGFKPSSRLAKIAESRKRKRQESDLE